MPGYLDALGSLGGLVGGGTIPADATSETLKRRRAVQAAIAAQKRKFPTTLGEGMTYLGEAVGERLADDRLTAAEQAQAARDAQLRGGAPAAVAPVVTAPPLAAAPVAARPAAAVAPAPAVVPAADTFDGKPITTVPVKKSEADPALLDRLTALLTGGEVPQENPTVGAEAPQVLGGPQPDQPVQLAALGGAGGTMTDAPPPGAGFRPPAATVIDDTVTPTDIKPMPVRTAQVGAPPSGVLPGSDASMFASPAFRPSAPRAADTSQGIPPAPTPVLPPDPGKPPQMAGETKDMKYWRALATDPRVGDALKAEAADRYKELKGAYDKAYTQSYDLWKAARTKRDDAVLADQENRQKLEQGQLTNLGLRRGLEGEGAVDLTPEERRKYHIADGVPAWKNRKGELKFGPAGQTINVGAGEKEEEKVRGKLAAEREDETLKSANLAANNLYTLNRAEALLKQIDTGMLEPSKTTVGAFGRAIGVSDEVLNKWGFKPEQTGTRQAFDAIAKELAIGKLGAGGFPSANFSNTDLKFLTGTVPSLGDDPASNRIKLAAQRLIAERDIEKAREWTAYRRNPDNKGKSFNDFNADWMERVEKKDITGELQRQAEALINNPFRAPTTAPFKRMPPPEAVRELRTDPSKAGFFDEEYGQGASRRFLDF